MKTGNVVPKLEPQKGKAQNIFVQMRRICVILMALLAFTVIPAGSSAAATGWVYADGSWSYYDRYGYPVTNEWAKDTNGYWYYLDRNGDMVTNSWIERSYYVDENGVMAANQWRKLRPASGDSFDDYAEQYWYYFSPNGTRVTSSWKTINDKRYYFDSQGKMQSGWVEEQHYMGGADDGSMKTGWVKALAPYDAEKGVADTDANQHWYYISNSGTLYKPDISSGASAGVRKINSITYAFDKEGKMLTGWVNLSTTKNSSNISDYKYFGTANDGAMKSGWQYIVAPEHVIQDSWDDGHNWFYLTNSGVPKRSETNNKFKKSDFVSINGKGYLFDQYGRCKYGLVWVGEELYYFGTKEQCIIQSGVFQIREANGSTSQFFFSDLGSDKGKGLSGVYDDHLYYKGKLQIASSRENFRIVSMTTSGSNKNYVVNSSGVVQKSATVTDGYGVSYRTNSKGILTHIQRDSVNPNEVLGEEPSEPVVD